MKKLKAFICAFIVGISAFCLFACGDNGGDNATLTSVKSNLREFYYITETINWDDFRVVSTYSDKTTKTSDSVEFDIDVEEAKSNTEWVVLTDGLKNETAGNMTAKEYNFIIKKVGTSDSYNQKITVDTDESRAYELDLWSLPKSISTFKDRTKTTGEGANPSGFKTLSNAKYYVGNDNGFDVTPTYTLYKIGTEDDVTVDISLDVKVLEGGTEVGESVYTYSDGKVKFAETVVDRTFTIKVSPKYFEQNRDGDDIPELSFEVVVKDGYNVYNALDLGMMSIVSEDSDINNYRRMDSSRAVFYNKATGSYYESTTNALWKNKFIQEGYTEDEIVNVKAVYIHDDINIAKTDIPAEFFITEDECNNNFAVGLLRDWSFIYSHAMESDFTLEGNYFTVDASALPVNGAKGGNGGKANIYENASQIEEFGHSKLFNFGGMSTATSLELGSNPYTVYVNNLTAKGNTNGIISATDDNAKMAAGGLIMFQNASCATKVENVNINSGMIGWYIEMTDEEYSSWNWATDYSDYRGNNYSKGHLQKSEFNNMNITDCFNSAFFSWGGAGGTNITNSYLARFGGPAIFAISRNDVSQEDGTLKILPYQAAHISYDDTVEFENFIVGTEAWFSVTEGAGAVMTSVKAVDALFNAYGKTILSADKSGIKNLKVLAMDAKYLKAQTKNLYSKINGYDFKNPYLTGVNSNNAPFIWTNGSSDNMCYIGGTTLNNITNKEVRESPLTGTEMCISYPISASGCAGIVFDMVDYVAPSGN